jgi:hypothetical protein
MGVIADRPGWMTRTQWSELDDGRYTPLPRRPTVADEPIADVVARVFALYENGAAISRRDAVRLAREVDRLYQAWVDLDVAKLEAEVAGLREALGLVVALVDVDELAHPDDRAGFEAARFLLAHMSEEAGRG